MEDPDEDINPADFESILNRVKRSGARVIVFKCCAEQVTKVLEQAWKLGLTKNHAWVLTDSAVGEVKVPSGITEKNNDSFSFTVRDYRKKSPLLQSSEEDLDLFTELGQSL